MKKLLAFLSVCCLVSTSTVGVVGCGPNNDVKKHEVTSDNLDAFFAKHNSFDYTGSFFFKGPDKTSDDEKTNESSSPILKDLLSKLMFKDFCSYFSWNTSKINFYIQDDGENNDISHPKGLQINKDYNYSFTFFAQKNIDQNLLPEDFYKKSNLHFHFKETSVYDKNEWAKNYYSLLFNSTLIFSQYKPDRIADYFLLAKWKDVSLFSMSNSPEALSYLNSKLLVEVFAKNSYGFFLYNEFAMDYVATSYTSVTSDVVWANDLDGYTLKDCKGYHTLR